MDHLALSGPLAASGLLLLGFGLPTVFVLSAIPATAALIVLVVMVREPRGTPPRPRMRR